MALITLHKINHRGRDCIGIYFKYEDYTPKLRSQLGLLNARYSNTKRCWYVCYSAPNYNQILSIFKQVLIKLDNGSFVTKVAEQTTREPLPIVNNDIQHQLDPEQVDDIATATTVSTVHKVSLNEVSLAQQLGFEHCYDYGKYWVVKLHYKKSIKDQLLSNKGIHWNVTHKRYMIMRHPKTRKFVHELFNESLLPDNYYYTGQQVSLNGVVTFDVYSPDRRYLRLYVTGSLDLKQQIKRLTMMRWDKVAHCFLFPATPQLKDSIDVLISGTNVQVVNHLPEGYLNRKNHISKRGHDYLKTKDHLLSSVPLHAREYIKELMDCIVAKHYSKHTLHSYTNAFHTLLQYFDYRDPVSLKRKEVISFLAYINEQCTSSSSVNNYVNALKFYFKHVLEWKDTQWDIPRPKKEKQLPVVLSENQIADLFNQVHNYKHKLILMLIYGSGLRISESINLQWQDIDFEQHKIHIKAAKGKKDRIVMLPYTLIQTLHNYKQMYQTTAYVFEGQIKGQPYSAESIRSIMNRAKKAAGIQQRATVHTLRHCFATHMLNSGTDIRFIQKVLGHQSIKTTTIYTHVSKPKYDNIKSPLDQLNINKQE